MRAVKTQKAAIGAQDIIKSSSMRSPRPQSTKEPSRFYRACENHIEQHETSLSRIRRTLRVKKKTTRAEP